MDLADNYEEKIALASYKSFNGLENWWVFWDGWCSDSTFTQVVEGRKEESIGHKANNKKANNNNKANNIKTNNSTNKNLPGQVLWVFFYIHLS